MNIVKSQDIKLILQKPLASLYTRNEEWEIKEINLLIITNNRVKYSGINLKGKRQVCRKPQDTDERTQRQYKQIERYIRFLYWKNEYSKNDRFNEIPIKLPMAYFNKTRTNSFIICMETLKKQIDKALLRKKNGVGRINLPFFRLYYKAMVSN